MHKEAGSFSKKRINSEYYRIVATRRPTIDLWGKIASPERFDALNYLESLTNQRLREERGETHLINDSDKTAIQNSSLVMAPFLYYSPDRPSRFSDGSFGVFYAALTLECAISETKYHTLRFLQDTNETHYSSERRVLTGVLEGEFYDIRNLPLVDIYSTSDYSAGQAFGRFIKENSDDGVVYDSVRHKGGTCFGVFRPVLIKSIREIKCLKYKYNGVGIEVEEISC